MEKPTRISLFESSRKMLIADFEKAKSEVPHYGERGEEAEQILIKWLNNHLPKRFTATCGFIMDDTDAISPQTDVIIYDAMNCPILRYSEKVFIIPADNAAFAFEVKSKLTKTEYFDASKKIADIKSLAKLNISDLDLLPEGAKKIVQSQTLGIIFAFECDVKLETVALWQREDFINGPGVNGRHCDFVCILNKGWLNLGIEVPETGVITISTSVFVPKYSPAANVYSISAISPGSNTVLETSVLIHDTLKCVASDVVALYCMLL